MKTLDRAIITIWIVLVIAVGLLFTDKGVELLQKTGLFLYQVEPTVTIEPLIQESLPLHTLPIREQNV